MSKWFQTLCFASCCFIFILTVDVTVLVAQAQDTNLLMLEKSISLPNVKGRIDHMAVDINGQRLFVAAVGNNSFEVIDLKTGLHARSIKGLNEPQGVLYLPDFDQIFVTNGGDGTCKIFDGRSLQLINTIKFPENADNIRYDPLKKQVYIGYGKGAIGIVDVKTGGRVGDIQITGHPEAFELEKTGPRIFANLPDTNSIVVIDRQRLEVVAQWPLANEKGNYPMALDESNHRLFIGCRNPAKVIVFDTESGKPVGNLEIAGLADDLFYDARNKRLYVSCGDGSLFVLRAAANHGYELAAKLTPGAGARTSLLVPEWDRFFLAIPHRDGQRAEIQVYTLNPE